jgi:nitrilase
LSKQNCRIAAVQMISGPRVADNLATAGRFIAEAVEHAFAFVQARHAMAARR